MSAGVPELDRGGIDLEWRSAGLTPADGMCYACGTPGLVGGDYRDRALYHGRGFGCTFLTAPLEHALNGLYPRDELTGSYPGPSGATAARIRRAVLQFADDYVPEQHAD